MNQMKNLLLMAAAGLTISYAQAQDFPGFRTSRYAGVNGVFTNPASIAGSPYKFDVNLFSLGTLASNDQASFKLGTMGKSLNGDSLSNQLFGKDAGPASGMVSLDFRGPSVLFNIGEKNSFAVTTRARMFANVSDVDGKLFDKISEDFNNDPSLPYTISSSEKMRVVANGWSEIGVSYGRELYVQGQHVLKAGITVKYLSGAGNGYINIDNFNGTIDDNLLLQDVYLQNTTGRIATGFGGSSFSDFKAGDLLSGESSGFGADLGVIYEYREKSDEPYTFKFGASLLDLGSIKYTKDAQRSGAYDIGITGNERLSLRELDGLDFDGYKAFFDEHTDFFTPAASNAATTYRVSLPTTLQLDADWHVQDGFFVSLASQLALSSNDSKGYNSRTYSSMTITPRYENKMFGAYIPLNYNELSKLNAGLSLRAGPVFVGSGSVISSLIGQSKQADFHFGVRFGALRKR